MENNPDDFLVLTILIQMHGKVFDLELTPEKARIFDNVRLLCGSKDFVDYESSVAAEVSRVSGLKQYFTHDLDESTYDILKKAKNGTLIDNITYDKTLSTVIGDPTWIDRISPVTSVQGVYLLSIHQGRRLIYPKGDEKPLNFLEIRDLNKLASKFETEIPQIINESTPLPNQKIYIDEEATVQNDKSLETEQKEQRIADIRNQFYRNLYNWQLTVEGNKIVSIKLTTLVELIKRIIGRPCFINLLDYSCNSISKYIPPEQKTLSKYAFQADIETGTANPEYGGKKKRHRRTRKNKRKYKRINKYKSRRNRKSNKRFNS
jgi:hypothetical protein